MNERWRPTAYEYRSPSEVVRKRDTETPARKGSRITGKSAGASKGAGRKSRKAVAGAAQA